MSVLSTKMKEPELVAPALTLIVAPHKYGKSTISAGLCQEFGPDKVKIISNEVGNYTYLKANVEECLTRGDFINALTTLDTADHTFDYVVIDNLSKVDEWAYIWGTLRYMKTLQGRKWNRDGNTVFTPEDKEWNDVTELGQNAWQWQRNVMIDFVEGLFRSIAKHVILIAHTKDKIVGNTYSESVLNTKQVNLTGKLSDIYPARVDAIATLEREENKAYLNFIRKDLDTMAGTRCKYLEGKRILISEMDEKGIIKTFWKQNIFNK